MLGSTLARDPEFQDRVVTETRALLSTVSALPSLPAVCPRGPAPLQAARGLYSWAPASVAAVFSRHAAVPRDDDAGHLRRSAAALTIAQLSRSQPPGLVLRLPDSCRAPSQGAHP
jgi:hypothetical protein